jgi:hypothetical protein
LNIFILLSALLLNATGELERTAAYICFIYMTSFYLIPGFFHICLGRFPFYSMDYPAENILRAAVVVLTFSVSFLLGYWLREQMVKSKKSRAIRAPIVKVRHSIDFGVAIACAIFALIIAWLVNFDYYFVSRGEVENVFQEVGALLNIELTIPRILSFGAFAFALAGLYQRRSAFGVISCALTFIVFATLNSPLVIPRYMLFAYPITLIVAFSNLMKRRSLLILIVFLAGQLTIFPIISTLSRGDVRDLSSFSPLEYYTSSGDFDGFQSTINVVTYADQTGLKWGANLLSAALFFVPRPLWPGKSAGTGWDAATFMGYDYTNVSSPLPSEFYVDFGIFGVFLGGAVVGYLLALADEGIRNARATKDHLRLLGEATVVGYLFILLRGSLVGVVGPFVVSYVMFWTIRGLARAGLLTFKRRGGRRRIGARRMT